MIKYLSNLFIICFFLAGCGTNSSQAESTEYPMPPEHNPVEITQRPDEGTTDDPSGEDSEPYIEDMNLPASASSRMRELLSNSAYQKRNGRIRRHKLAKKLNGEGYTTSEGKEFRIKDIPKN
jgi:hypothetical protein